MKIDGLTEQYFKPLVDSLESNRCIENAAPMKKYMKDISDFLGLKSENRKKILSAFIRNNGYPANNQLFSSIIYLWGMQYREYQYCGMEMLAKPAVKFNSEDIEIIEYMITTKSWWDTVDMVAASVAGKYFKAYPDKIKTVTRQWINTDNIWLKRSAILFQLKYKNETDTWILFDYITKEAGHKDFFIRKAIGWALREYSKTNPGIVKDFINNTVLSPLSRKEGLKIINKKETANES